MSVPQAIIDLASLWGSQVTRLIAARENHVYEVSLSSGERAALRLHRPGYQTRASIKAELQWTSSLADRGFPCPRPVPNSAGDDLVETDGGIATMVSWVDASPILDLAERGGDLAPIFRKLGSVLAELHDLSDNGAYDGITERPDWGLEALTSESPHWGKYWENPALTDSEADRLFAARSACRTWLLDRQFETGAIHADAISENVLGHADELWLIDFDDAGTGYRGYDLGVSLVQFWDRDDFPDLVTNLAEGYAQSRGCEAMPLALDIPKFTALRAMASAGWIISRKPADDPIQRRYVDRALGCVQRFIL